MKKAGTGAHVISLIKINFFKLKFAFFQNISIWHFASMTFTMACFSQSNWLSTNCAVMLSVTFHHMTTVDLHCIHPRN